MDKSFLKRVLFHLLLGPALLHPHEGPTLPNNSQTTTVAVLPGKECPLCPDVEQTEQCGSQDLLVTVSWLGRHLDLPAEA